MRQIIIKDIEWKQISTTTFYTRLVPNAFTIDVDDNEFKNILINFDFKCSDDERIEEYVRGVTVREMLRVFFTEIVSCEFELIGSWKRI